AGILLYWAAGSSSSVSTTKVVAAVDTVDGAERRLANLRRQLSTRQAKQALLKQVSNELTDREKGLIPGDTADQAQAQLLQILKRVGREQNPPLEIRQVEFAQPRAYGDAYGTVTVSVTIDSRPDELVNYLTAISALPELTATEEIRTSQANAKQKNMPVRITVSGIVARRLIPDRKGLPQL